MLNESNHSNGQSSSTESEQTYEPATRQEAKADEQKGKKSKRPLIIGGVSLGVVAAIAGASVLGINANNGAKPPQATESSAPADPSESATPTPEQEYTVEALSISGDLINDPQALIETYTDRLNQWVNAGSTPENAGIIKDSGFDHDTIVALAASYDQVFIDSLFGPNWQTDPGVAQLVAQAVQAHADTLSVYCTTSFPNLTPEDKKPYVRSTAVDSVVNSSPNADGSVTIQSAEHDTDNKDENSVGEIGPYPGVTGETVTPTRQFANIDGSAKVVGVVFG